METMSHQISPTPISGGPESQYIRNHEYTGKVVSSSIPDINYGGYSGYNQPNTEPIGPDSHRFREGEFVGPGFFQNIDLSIFALPQTEVDWSYNLRRAAQRILPFLWLGPWSYLSNQQWLRDEGITLLLGVRDQRLAHLRLVSGAKAAKDVGIEADSFDVVDGQDLISRLPQTIRRINDHIHPTGNPVTGKLVQKKIFVFCETGNGLSALVVVAYCMVMLNMSLGQALNFIHSQRFCVDFDDTVKPMLLAFEELLEAKRDVEKAKKTDDANSSLNAPAMSVSRKRNFADQVEDEDEDEDMEDDGMEVESLDRKPQAPFQDRFA
ncbi:hypothetical protein BDV18DRAFT_157096 [Aspergillus unguis]